MDKLTRYRVIIQKLLADFAVWANRTPPPDTELLTVFDERRDYYLLLNVRWGKFQAVQGAQVFVRIVNEKIYIEEDWTEESIATGLLNEGVPKQDIVLAFQPPEVRARSEFALA